jgi:hypothetical protein
LGGGGGGAPGLTPVVSYAPRPILKAERSRITISDSEKKNYSQISLFALKELNDEQDR